jgi:hypothetical protein
MGNPTDRRKRLVRRPATGLPKRLERRLNGLQAINQWRSLGDRGMLAFNGLPDGLGQGLALEASQFTHRGINRCVTDVEGHRVHSII